MKPEFELTARPFADVKVKLKEDEADQDVVVAEAVVEDEVVVADISHQPQNPNALPRLEMMERLWC